MLNGILADYLKLVTKRLQIQLNALKVMRANLEASVAQAVAKLKAASKSEDIE